MLDTIILILPLSQTFGYYLILVLVMHLFNIFVIQIRIHGGVILVTSESIILTVMPVSVNCSLCRCNKIGSRLGSVVSPYPQFQYRKSILSGLAPIISVVALIKINIWCSLLALIISPSFTPGRTLEDLIVFGWESGVQLYIQSFRLINSLDGLYPFWRRVALCIFMPAMLGS